MDQILLEQTALRSMEIKIETQVLNQLHRQIVQGDPFGPLPSPSVPSGTVTGTGNPPSWRQSQRSKPRRPVTQSVRSKPGYGSGIRPSATFSEQDHETDERGRLAGDFTEVEEEGKCSGKTKLQRGREGDLELQSVIFDTISLAGGTEGRFESPFVFESNTEGAPIQKKDLPREGEKENIGPLSREKGE